VRLALVFAAALLTTGTAGCGGTARPVPYTDITAKVGALEFTHLTVDVSKSRTKLLGVLERNNPGRPISLPPIDFNRHETFLVAVGPRSTTGYALRIVRVQKKGGLVQVVVHERTPSLGDAVQVRVTYPFRLIVLPRSGAAVKLKWPGRP